jgi:threonine dehydrogenase-like Zn-dependent dehydrogenase
MQAVAVFPSTRDIRVIDHPEPMIRAPRQVKLRAVEIGICGTDREICSFHYGTPPRGQGHLVIGHEMLAEVVEVGAGVSSLRAGDLVVPMVRRPCPHAHCAACRAGRQDFCYTGDFTERGIKASHGYMGEFVVDDERFMVRVPPALREVAVLVEPLTIAEKALLQVHDIQQRLPWTCPKMAAAAGVEHRCHNAVVLGAGPVGLLGAMALVAAGFRTFVYSREPAPNRKSEIAAAFGATYVSSSQHSVDALADIVGAAGSGGASSSSIDLVYEAVGASSLAFDVINVLGTNGVFVFTGVPGRMGPIQVDTDLVMRNLVLKNQCLFGTVNAGRDAFDAALRDLEVFMQRWPDAVRALFTNRIRIDAAPRQLANGRGSIKDVIAYA